MDYGAYALTNNELKIIDPKISQLLYLFWYQNVGSQAGFVVFQLSHNTEQTQNIIERQVVRQQILSPVAWVHSQVGLSGVCGGRVAVGQICLSPSVICCQYQSTNSPQPFTYLSPTPNNLTN